MKKEHVNASAPIGPLQWQSPYDEDKMEVKLEELGKNGNEATI
jgi:hypothetical protein